MKTCVSLILLTILCPGGCPVYDFDIKTIEGPDFTNDLKLEAELNSELEQGLMKMNIDKVRNGYEQNLYRPIENYRMSEDRALVAAPTNMANANTNSNSNNNINNNGPEEITKPERECPDQVVPVDSDSFVGTNLFDGNRKKCFSSEDVALLAARKDFELLIPKDLPQCLFNNEMVNVLMKYFYGSNQVIQRMSDDCSKRLTEKAFYDMLGGYLKYYIVPVTKYSFYGGKINLETVQNVVSLYHQCKIFLNTNGNGWKAPMTNVLTELKNVRIEPIKIKAADAESGEQTTCCAQLDLSSVNNDAEDEQMIVSLPKLEPEDNDGYLGNVWLPFKRKRTFNLRSCKSAFILVKFYETVTRCYQFQSMCQDMYNHKFKLWILENIQVHLADEQFYPGLGSILQIYENLRRGKKAIDEIDDATTGNEDDDSSSSSSSSSNDDDDEESNDDDHSEEQSTPEKRQKSEEFKAIDNKAKQLSGQNENWFGKLDDKRKPGKVKCANTTKVPTTVKCVTKKKKTKNKNKSKNKDNKKGKDKTKPEPKPSDGGSSHFASTVDYIQRTYIKYICYIVALILLILLIILCCAMCVKYRPAKKSTKPPGATPPKKKRKTLCERLQCCRRKKTPRDEEILIKSDSASVIASRQTQSQPLRRSTTSTSSLACHPKTKCIPITRRSAKDSEKSDAPIIETTSLDYSSSESEAKPKSKLKKQKVVTIDEKKRLKGGECTPNASPRKKRFSSKFKRETTPPANTSTETKEKSKFARRLGLDRGSTTTTTTGRTDAKK